MKAEDLRKALSRIGWKTLSPGGGNDFLVNHQNEPTTFAISANEKFLELRFNQNFGSSFKGAAMFSFQDFRVVCYNTEDEKNEQAEPNCVTMELIDAEKKEKNVDGIIYNSFISFYNFEKNNES